MIQTNLLPDVKIQYIKVQRIKRLVILGSSLLGIVTLVIFLLLFAYVDIAQKKHLSDLSRDITNTQKQLGDTNNLNRILTIQNQLQILPSLDAQKPVANRLFNYLTAVTPASATIDQVSVNFAQNINTIEIKGNSDTLTTINQYVDTLKFTTYSAASTPTIASKAFSNVVLSSFGLQTGKGANYTIDLVFDPTIFAEASKVNLTVPKITTTRSITDQPTDLFKKSPPVPNAGNTNGSNP